MKQYQKLFYKYENKNSLLVVNQKGVLRRLYTPFRVLCSAQVDLILVNTWVYVEEVHLGANNKLDYLIGDRFYSHSNFLIIIHF